jgi:hypothetical protein
MTRTLYAFLLPLLLGGVALGGLPALAQEAADGPAVEPAAIEALDKMAAHLRTLEQFRLIATISRDDVFEGGQLVEIAGRTIYSVRRPDRMKVEVITDKAEREFYYDGKTVTQFAPALGFYSVFEAAPTIAETFDLAEEKYDVELPLADLFYWGTERSNLKAFSAAFAAGQTRIGGETCRHYAYRSDVTDIQVWIRTHGDPLPCRMVIVTTDDEARPRFAATLEWDLDPLLGDTLFSFAPPPGAEKIEQEDFAADAN